MLSAPNRYLNSSQQHALRSTSKDKAEPPTFRFFKGWDNSSPKTVNVRNLGQNIDTNTDERGRT